MLATTFPSGLQATVQTARMEYEDAGHFAIYAAAHPERIEAVLAAILA